MDKIYDKCCGIDVHKKLIVWTLVSIGRELTGYLPKETVQ